MSRLDEFTGALKDFGAIGALAVGGSLLAPILAAAAGLSPPGAENLPFVASVLMLLVLMLLFQFQPQSPRRYALLLVSAALLLAATLIAHLLLHMRFVHGPLILGCGWRPELVLLAGGDNPLHLDPQRQCPGDHRALLGMQDNDPFQIWTADSIDFITHLLAGTWVALFVFLALALGSFVIHNSRQPGRSPEPPKDASTPKDG